MEWAGGGETVIPDEEELACKEAAEAIRQSMDKCQEFWSEVHHELAVIPAYKLKSPPYKNNYYVKMASELAELMWNNMTQNDLEELAHINKILLKNGEISSDNIVPQITCILNKTVGADVVRSSLYKINKDFQEALLLVANQLIYIYNENILPSFED